MGRKNHIWTAKERKYLEDNKYKSNVELAGEMGKTAQQVAAAKQRWKLTRKSKTLAECKDKFLEAYEEGLSDGRTAARLFVGTTTIAKWRGLLNLPAHRWNKVANENMKKVFQKKQADREKWDRKDESAQAIIRDRERKDLGAIEYGG